MSAASGSLLATNDLVTLFGLDTVLERKYSKDFTDAVYQVPGKVDHTPDNVLLQLMKQPPSLTPLTRISFDRLHIYPGEIPGVFNVNLGGL